MLSVFESELICVFYALTSVCLNLLMPVDQSMFGHIDHSDTCILKSLSTCKH